ncbi:glycyl-radical enzyme activating protein [Bacillota bacterium]
MKQPLIIELKANSLDDGPGVRSVVFVKGCPLSCLWCHNPESKRTAQEISYSRPDCIGCGLCLQSCKQQALDKEKEYYIDRGKCNLCFACADVCPAKALTRVGKEISAEEIVSTVLSDKPFFDVSGGGVTLSGGEITMFPEYAGHMLRQFKSHGIHTLIETCGHFQFNVFKEMMLPFTDMIYYDIKLFDSDLHKEYCGVGNKTILKNFIRLQELSKDGSFELIPRTPLIPDITDRDLNLSAIAGFLKECKVKKAHLLPYNPTWVDKIKKIGMEDPENNYVNKKWQSEEKLAECKSFFLERGITVDI